MSSVLWCMYLGTELLDDAVTPQDFGKAAKPSFFTYLSAMQERSSFSAALTKLAVFRCFYYSRLSVKRNLVAF